MPASDSTTPSTRPIGRRAILLVVIVAGAMTGCDSGQSSSPSVGLPLIFTQYTVMAEDNTVNTSGEGYAVIADFNDDGYIDAACGFASDSSVVLHVQTTVGKFTNTVIASGHGSILSLAAADIDSARQLDIIAATDTGHLVLLLAPSFSVLSGPWSDSTFENPTTISAWRDVQTAELNDQTGLEVIATAPAENVIVIWQSSGLIQTAADYSATIVAQGSGQAFERLSTADIDGDADLDIIAVGSAAGAGLVWLENPGGASVSGSWTVRQITTRTGLTRLVACDLDNDDDIDVACTDPSTNRVYWYENPGTPKANSWQQYELADFSPYSPDAINAVDVNADGTVDLLIGTEGSTGRIFWASPFSNFRETWRTQLITQTYAGVGELPADDIDGLDKVDLITTLAGSTTPVIFLQQR